MLTRPFFFNWKEKKNTITIQKYMYVPSRLSAYYLLGPWFDFDLFNSEIWTKPIKF